MTARGRTTTESRRAWDASLAAALQARAEELAAEVRTERDPVERALYAELRRAVAAERWEAVGELGRALEGPRRAKAETVSLDSARARKSGGT